jgi:hypothetical protein
MFFRWGDQIMYERIACPLSAVFGNNKSHDTLGSQVTNYRPTRPPFLDNVLPSLPEVQPASMFVTLSALWQLNIYPWLHLDLPMACVSCLSLLKKKLPGTYGLGPSRLVINSSIGMSSSGCCLQRYPGGNTFVLGESSRSFVTKFYTKSMEAMQLTTLSLDCPLA